MNEIEKFGKMINSRVQQVGRAVKDAPPELGVINGDLSLSVSSLKNPIPHGDYMLCRQLTLGPTNADLTVTAVDGRHTVWNPSWPDTPPFTVVGKGEDHSHVPLIPETMRWIKPGDRVLVAWVGTEAVVIDLVYNSKPYGG